MAPNKDKNKTYLCQTKTWIINKYTNNDEEEGKKEDNEESTSQSILAVKHHTSKYPEVTDLWKYFNYDDDNVMELLQSETPKFSLSTIKHKTNWYLTKADKNASYKNKCDVLQYWKEKEQQ